MGQANWRRCSKCQGLFFADQAASRCPAGGGHEASAGAGSYVLAQEQTDADVAGLEDGSGRFRPSGTSCALRGESVSAIGFGVIGMTSASPKSVEFLQTVLGLPDNPHGGRFAGVAGVNWDGVGAAHIYGAGVVGRSDSQSGVVGLSDTARGVWGASETFIGTVGDSASGTGVWGHSKTGQGIYALSDAGDGLVAETKGAEKTGVIGRSPSGRGIWGWSESFMGTVGDSVSGSGVFGHSQSGAGVYAISDSSRGLVARGVPAGRFEGDVEVTGDIKLVNGDCAEDFPAADPSGLEPGDVLVIDEAGSLRRSEDPYDRRVAGVVAGAGGTRPAIVLNRRDGADNQVSVALVGRVFCKADAREEAIGVGDLLTTASVSGHAMRASDPARAFGAVIGKALAALGSGVGLIPMLIALQ